MKTGSLVIGIVWLLLVAPLTAGPAETKPLPPSAAALIAAALETGDAAAAKATFEALRAEAGGYRFVEGEFNALGYRRLQAEDMAGAVAVFRMSVALFPQSVNAYDSLAEGCLNAGDLEGARENYNRVLALEPANQNARRMLDGLEVQFKRIQDEKKIAGSPGLQTGLQGPYLGQEPPGKEPRIFAPGLVSMVNGVDYACTFSPDGREFYFTRSRATQVIMVCRLEKEGWTAPEPVVFSAGYSAHEPHLTFDNRTIYWGWFHPVPAGEPKPLHDYGIYASDRIPSGWGPARFVGQAMYVNSDRAGRIYVTESNENGGFLTRATLKKGRFVRLERLAGGMEKLRPPYKIVAHPAIAPDGSYILFDVEGGSHLFVCFRNPDDTWGEAIDLSQHGIDVRAGIPTVSPDGKYFFFGCDGDLYWASTALIENLRPVVPRSVKK